MKSMFYKSIATALALLIGISMTGCSQERV